MNPRHTAWAKWRNYLHRADTFGQIFSAMALHGALIVVVVGGISLGFLHHLLQARAATEMTAAARLEAATFEQRLGLTQEEVRNLSANTLLSNALVDTDGANKAYLGPFFKSYKPTAGFVVGLTLCDFKGVPLASSNGGEKPGASILALSEPSGSGGCRHRTRFRDAAGKPSGPGVPGDLAGDGTGRREPFGRD